MQYLEEHFKWNKNNIFQQLLSGVNEKTLVERKVLSIEKLVLIQYQ